MKNLRDLFIRILAFFCVGIGALMLLAAFGGTIYFWISLKDANIVKKILFEILVLGVGLFGFLTGVGLYQYIFSFLEMEQEIEKIEEEEKEIKEDINEIKENIDKS